MRRVELLQLFFAGEMSTSSANRTSDVAAEISDCLSYFEIQTHVAKERKILRYVLGIGIKVGRLEGKESGYYWEIDGVRKTTERGSFTGSSEYEAIVEKIHNIMPSYKEHVMAKRKSLAK